MTNVHQLSPSAAEPPPEMTREDRRIIYAKLNEVYLDETKGYSESWTDKRVAEELGCPRVWVETVRDEMFGPARTNEEIGAVLTEWREVKEQIEAASMVQGNLVAETSRVSALLKDLNERASRIARRIDTIERAVLP